MSVRRNRCGPVRQSAPVAGGHSWHRNGEIIANLVNAMPSGPKISSAAKPASDVPVIRRIVAAART
jgi:hypothetical protein